MTETRVWKDSLNELIPRLNEQEYTYGFHTMIYLPEKWQFKGRTYTQDQTELIERLLTEQFETTLVGLHEDYVGHSASQDEPKTPSGFSRYLNAGEDVKGITIPEAFLMEALNLPLTAMNTRGSLYEMIDKWQAKKVDLSCAYLVFCWWEYMEGGAYTVKAVNMVEAMKRLLSSGATNTD